MWRYETPPLLANTCGSSHKINTYIMSSSSSSFAIWMDFDSLWNNEWSTFWMNGAHLPKVCYVYVHTHINWKIIKKRKWDEYKRMHSLKKRKQKNTIRFIVQKAYYRDDQQPRKCSKLKEMGGVGREKIECDWFPLFIHRFILIDEFMWIIFWRNLLRAMKTYSPQL